MRKDHFYINNALINQSSLAAFAQVNVRLNIKIFTPFG